MKLTVLIPARNEEHIIKTTINNIYLVLKERKILHEILVIDDGSEDKTYSILTKLKKSILTLRVIKNDSPNGFGYAVKKGLENYKGDAVVIMMADESDSTKDLIAYHEEFKKGNDCVFGSRFMKKGKTIDYPLLKKILNRLTNNFIRILFWIKYDDTSNAFKGYKREVITGIKPLLSNQFNLTVEMPLKAIIRGYTYAVIPITWRNRTRGKSKFHIKEMGNKYLKIIMHCFSEKLKQN